MFYIKCFIYILFLFLFCFSLLVFFNINMFSSSSTAGVEILLLATSAGKLSLAATQLPLHLKFFLLFLNFSHHFAVIVIRATGAVSVEPLFTPSTLNTLINPFNRHFSWVFREQYVAASALVVFLIVESVLLDGGSSLFSSIVDWLKRNFSFFETSKVFAVDGDGDSSVLEVLVIIVGPQEAVDRNSEVVGVFSFNKFSVVTSAPVVSNDRLASHSWNFLGCCRLLMKCKIEFAVLQQRSKDTNEAAGFNVVGGEALSLVGDDEFHHGEHTLTFCLSRWQLEEGGNSESQFGETVLDTNKIPEFEALVEVDRILVGNILITRFSNKSREIWSVIALRSDSVLEGSWRYLPQDWRSSPMMERLSKNEALRDWAASERSFIAVKRFKQRSITDSSVSSMTSPPSGRVEILLNFSRAAVT